MGKSQQNYYRNLLSNLVWHMRQMHFEHAIYIYAFSYIRKIQVLYSRRKKNCIMKKSPMIHNKMQCTLYFYVVFFFTLLLLYHERLVHIFFFHTVLFHYVRFCWGFFEFHLMPTGICEYALHIWVVLCSYIWLHLVHIMLTCFDVTRFVRPMRDRVRVL